MHGLSFLLFLLLLLLDVGRKAEGCVSILLLVPLPRYLPEALSSPHLPRLAQKQCHAFFELVAICTALVRYAACKEAQPGSLNDPVMSKWACW